MRRVSRQVVNRVRPGIRHKYVQAAAEAPVELELHRVVGGTGVVAQNDGIGLSTFGAKSPSNEATAQSANVCRRKCLLPDGLFYRGVPLPGVGEPIALCGAEHRPNSYGKRECMGSRRRSA